MSGLVSPPRARLALLTAAVLLAHLAILRGVPSAARPGDGDTSPAALRTRTLAAEPAPPRAALPVPAAAPARPRPPPAVSPRADPTPAAAAATPVPAELPEPATVAESSPADATPSVAGDPQRFVAGPLLPPPVATPAVSPPALLADIPAAPTAADRWAARLAPPQRLAYEVAGEIRRLPYTARAELVWQHDGAQYRARLEVGALFMGSRVQTSEGRLDDFGLAPLRFGDRAREEQAAHFDAAAGRIRFSANTPDAPLSPGAQDRLSLFLQIGALAAANPGRFAPGSTITVQTASAREADAWVLRVGDPETLDLPAGVVPTISLVREPRRPYDLRLELWLAPSWDYLPVRVRLTQANGDFVDQRLRSRSALPSGL